MQEQVDEATVATMQAIAIQKPRPGRPSLGFEFQHFGTKKRPATS